MATRTRNANNTEHELESRWQEKSGSYGDVIVWGAEGVPFEITGEFRGFAEGKFGPDTLLSLTRDGQKETWTLPVVLKDKLTGVPIGCPVRIQLQPEKIETRAGQFAYDFKVWTDKDYMQEHFPFEDK